MSARKLIAELERRRYVSDRVLTKLRESLASARTPLSAEKVAQFLVQKNQLTTDQANNLLAGLSQSGVSLNEEDSDLEADDGSSIFGPGVLRPSRSADPPESGSGDDDEIRLAPIGSGFTPGDSNPRGDDEIAPELGVLSPIEGEDSRIDELAPVPQLTEVIESEEPYIPYRRTEQDEVTFSAAPIDTPKVATQSPVRRTTRLGREKPGQRREKKNLKRKKSWDSPLILIGGGSLIFLTLAGAAIWFVLNWESGDQKLALAREASKSGAYPQAIEHYQDFIATSRRHPEYSLARVELAMLRIRQPTEAGDFTQAIGAVGNETKGVEDEPAFSEAHEELAALIPQIAQGLAKQAEQAPPTSDDSKKFVELANKALELCDNASYVPKQLRDEAKLAAIRDSLVLVGRRQQSQLALDAGLKSMQDAIAQGKPAGSYAAYAMLLKDHPELASEKTLSETIRKTAAAEKALVRFVDEKRTAETTERPTPWLAALAVASHRGGAAPATGYVCVRIDGAVYGLEAATGRLLWRRYTGYGAAGWPKVIDNDVLITDSIRHELLRVEAPTGRLLWRQTFNEPFAQPLVVGDRGYVASDSGRIHLVDLKAGAVVGYLQLPQPVRVTPAIDRLKKHLYVAGDRASVYTISLADMKCDNVYFSGHGSGTVQVPPTLVMDKLALAENSGTETSRLRLLAVDDKFIIKGQQAERRLTGLVTVPPIANGRSLVVVTDRGQIDVYEISPGNEGEALAPVATRPATGSQPITRHAAVVGRNIWVGDTQLSKYNIVPTNNRLPVEEIQNSFAGAAFDHPVTAIGDTLFEVHRPKGKAGVVVAAIDTKQGRALWESDLAVPPAGEPVVDEPNKSLTTANALGQAFRFDEAAIRSRVQDRPLAAQLAPPQLPELSGSADLGQGRAAFFAPNSQWLLLYNPGQGSGAKWVRLEGSLAGGLTAFGPGFIAPLKLGQVFLLSAADGSKLAAPFQPRIEPGSTVDFRPAAVNTRAGRNFVVSDGASRLYNVSLVDQPQLHLEATKDADVGPRPISSPVVILGDTVLGVGGDSRLLRFKLASLEPSGDSALPAPVEWGPYAAGETALLATVDQKLIAALPSGEVKWQAPNENGQLAGPPLVIGDAVVLAYRKGVVERRALADGKPLAAINVEHPLATGPVSFLQKLVVTSADGTLFVLPQP